LPHATDTNLNYSDNATTCTAHIVDPASPFNTMPATRTILNVAPLLPSANVIQATPPTNPKRIDAMHCQKKAFKTPPALQTARGNVSTNGQNFTPWEM
jgi:hypothetical protein